jgi:23S rRNA (guanine745-N1)-methyltransferase
MVRARTSFLASGVYEPIAREVAEVIGDHVLPPPAELRDETPAGRPARVATGPLLADLGGGTGYYSAYVLNHVPEFEGVLLDASAPAAKVAVRAHPRLTVATADLWRAIPLPTANVDVALVVFAPRNPAEIARILKSDGICVVATPQPDHLAELRAVVPLLGIEPDKGTRLESQFAGFGRFETRFVTYQTALDPTAIAEVIGMGPSAYHLSPANIADRAAAAGRRLVTVSVAVDVFTRGA